jgi:predicted nucleic acid-binding protein
MKVLLDTNVLLDAIADREPFCVEAKKIITLILDNKLDGYITANSTADIFYIARKHLTHTDLHATMHALFAVFNIIDVLSIDCHKALKLPFGDYEDALVMVCGIRTGMDYIITRDEEFLRKGNAFLPVILPADFIKIASGRIGQR